MSTSVRTASNKRLDTTDYPTKSKAKKAGGNLRFSMAYDNPFRKDWKGSCYTGQLLGSGIAQHEANGRWMGKRYGGLLEDGEGDGDASWSAWLWSWLTWSKLPESQGSSASKKIYARADHDSSLRTIQSAEALIAGLLEKQSSDNHVRIHMDDDESSNILPNERTCPRLKEVMAAYSNSDVIQNVKNEYEKLVLPELEAIFRR